MTHRSYNRLLVDSPIYINVYINTEGTPDAGNGNIDTSICICTITNTT